MSSDGKRQMLGNSEARDEINHAFDILRMKEGARGGPTLLKQVQQRLRSHPVFCEKDPNFIFHVLDHIVTNKHEQYFLDLDEDLIIPYIRHRGFNF